MEHAPIKLANGKLVCSGCNRPVHTVSQGSARPKRSRLIVYEPPGEEGVLEDLLDQLVARYQKVWPDILSEAGERHWRYKSLHWSLLALVTASEDVAKKLMPSETGE